MSIKRLTITHLRNLKEVDISPSPELNFIFGANGSGKTSLLEAVSLLAHGRSFRTHKFRRVIAHEHHQFTVFGLLQRGTVELPMGVSRHRSGDTQFKVAGETVQSSAKLAENLPLQVINADSFSLLSGPPSVRRQFFDWLVFHMKPDFGQHWKQVRRCLKQRNSLLRHDKIGYSDLLPWDHEICRLSDTIQGARQECLELFKEAYKPFVAEASVSLDYVSGWKADTPLSEQLERNFDRDKQQGYTSIGPHKSELKIKQGSISAAEVLSRGQQKTLITALHLAAASAFTKASGRYCVFLIDDMPAELDADHIQLLGSWLNQLGGQIFITGVDIQDMIALWPNIKQKDSAMFHVKHGSVETVVNTMTEVE